MKWFRAVHACAAAVIQYQPQLIYEKIILLAVALVVFAGRAAETNNVPGTNSIAAKKIPAPKVVTREMVLGGLTTISNQIVVCGRQGKKIGAANDMLIERWRLEYSAHKITIEQMSTLGNDLYNKTAPALATIGQQMAELKLQDFNLRQRYAALLANTNLTTTNKITASK